jgi:hypothetical protein
VVSWVSLPPATTRCPSFLELGDLEERHGNYAALVKLRTEEDMSGWNRILKLLQESCDGNIKIGLELHGRGQARRWRRFDYRSSRGANTFHNRILIIVSDPDAGPFSEHLRQRIPRTSAKQKNTSQSRRSSSDKEQVGNASLTYLQLIIEGLLIYGPEYASACRWYS